MQEEKSTTWRRGGFSGLVVGEAGKLDSAGLLGSEGVGGAGAFFLPDIKTY